VCESSKLGVGRIVWRSLPNHKNTNNEIATASIKKVGLQARHRFAARILQSLH